jgi:hypothetical protein
MFALKGLLGLGFGAALILTGCAGSTPASNAPAGASTQAIACDGCKVTWVQVADTNGKGRVIGYHSAEKMTCPDCTDAVQNFFASGKFEHNCKACGGNMTICEAHAG